MTNKEQVQQDIAVAFDFIEHIIENPELIDKIPEGSAINFIDEGNRKPEKLTAKIPTKKYLKVRKQFELL
jgi:hypothetical protein